MADRYSILVDNFNKCVVCGTTKDIHIHEVFYGTANRKKSIEWGCCIPLCGYHHNLSNQGIHFNKNLDLYWKQYAEKKWIETNCTSEQDGIEEFIRIFGRNYLDV